MRENRAEKAKRYLTEGRVVVVEVRPGYARAIVRGTGALHEVTETAAGRTCSCQALTTCSHQLALGMVTAPVTSSESRS